MTRYAITNNPNNPTIAMLGTSRGYKAMSKEETWKVAKDIEVDHPETAVRLRLMYLLREQRNKDNAGAAAKRASATKRAGGSRQVAPTRPRIFYDLLRLCYVAPLPEYVESPLGEFRRRQAVDKAFKNFVVSARQLNSLAPEMAHYHSLTILMEGRLPASGQQRENACQFLEQLQSLVTFVKGAPGLKPRREEKKPPRVDDGYVRDLVRAVCWYLEAFEGDKPTASTEGGDKVTGRAGILVSLAIKALDLKVSSSLSNQIREVVAAAEWRRPGYGWWDNIPTTARPS